MLFVENLLFLILNTILLKSNVAIKSGCILFMVGIKAMWLSVE